MNNFEKIKLLEFTQKGDERGRLVIIESGNEIPFDIERVFYIYGSDSTVVRGMHANKKSEFVLINVAGSSKLRIENGLGNELVYCLNRPHTGVYIPSMLWKEMYDFSEDSVLLCLSSKKYDADEYIRDYAEYKAIMKKSGD